MTGPELVPPRIVPVSARGRTALERTAQGLAAFLTAEPDVGLDDVSTTLVHGREVFEHRLAVVAGDAVSAAAALADPAGNVASRRGEARGGRPQTIFAFSGQGSQYSGMAAGAYAAFPDFRQWLDRAEEVLSDDLPLGLRRYLFDPELADALARTDVAAAAIAAVQLGLVRVLERYGIVPDVVIGHSVGEFCAAAVAGAVDPEDALRLVARRGALMVELTEPGAMLAVRCAADAGPGEPDAAAVAALAVATPGAGVAVRNSARELVLSGTAQAIAELETRLAAAGLSPRRLHVSHAFHSELLRPMLGPFGEAVGAVRWAAPTAARWISCSRAAMTEAPDVRYWQDHLMDTVRFGDALALACADDAPTVLVEIGPHPVLLPLAGQLPSPPLLVPTLARDQDAAIALAGAAAQAWCHGVPADLTGGRPGRRRHLPGYGFDRREHSPRPADPLAPAAVAVAPAEAAEGAPARPAKDVLAALWTDLLGGAPEAESGFITSGGDSLTLLHLHQRLQGALGAVPSLAELFDAGTFGAMAQLLPDAGTPEAAPQITPDTAERTAAMALEPVASYQPSAMQQGMLLIDLMQPGSNQHNVTLAFEVAGRVDAAAVAGAFRDAQHRHSALRTVFSRVGGRFEAHIASEPGAELELVDATADGVAALADDADVRRWARELSDPPAPCVDAVPVRGALVSGADRSLLVVTAHHAVCDATSMGLMLDELAADYHRRRAGAVEPAGPAAVQFHELREELERASDESADRAYWLAQLDGAPDLVPLPTDRPRPAVRRGAGAQLTRLLDADRFARARAAAAELNVTLFSSMLATFAALLRARSGAEDLTIATPATGRTTERSQRAFGPLLNTVVLRIGVAGDQPFGELARDVQRTVLEAIGHSGFPFDRLVAELKPQRDPGRTPLFSVMFTMPDQFDLPTFDGHASSPVELPGLGAKFDLTLYVTPADDGKLRLDFEYDPALFDESTMRSVADDYTSVLDTLPSGGLVTVPPDERADPATAPSAEPALTAAGGLSELEAWVAELWSDVLGVPITSAADDFFDAGGHSMLVLVGLAEVQDRYPEATIEDFFVHRTVAAFAARIAALAGDGGDGAARGDVDGGENAGAGAAEPADHGPQRTSAAAASAPTAAAGVAGAAAGVLVTGGAGFLGAHLLGTLLRRPAGSMVCVVRGRDGVGGRARLEQTLARYAPDVVPASRERVEVIEADLREWDPAAAGSALDAVGLVVHSAADSRMFGRIEDFRAINVAPTIRLAELARARGWHFAHVSTASAVAAAPGDGPAITLREEDFDRGEEFDNPYSRSKFEAEKAVRELMAAGLEATVHRVADESATGTFLPDPKGNLLYALLQAFLRCGLIIDAPGFSLNLTPVDFAAAAILELAGTSACAGRTFHVMNPTSLTMPSLTGIVRDLGYAAVLADPERIVRWLSRDDADDADRQALPFLRPFMTVPQTVVEHDTKATTDALEAVACPPPGPNLMRTLLAHGVDTGFFPRPRLWDFAAQHFGAPS
jgi:thioester reductase-like protein